MYLCRYCDRWTCDGASWSFPCFRADEIQGSISCESWLCEANVSPDSHTLNAQDPKKLVISDPEVMSIDLNQDDNLLLLACDGMKVCLHLQLLRECMHKVSVPKHHHHHASVHFQR